jgi:phage recombination protein Bet
MALPDFTASQLTTIKNTVAKDTNHLEFDLFMNAARSYGLDPFRKQISAIVFSKDNAQKRQMAIIVGRDGLRSIAARCGDYRPASGPANIVYDDASKCPANPKGIVSVGITLFKQDNRGEWHPVYGEAFWDEFAPLKDEWAYNDKEGKRTPTGEKTVDGNWAKMPIVMLTKCAEGQALRAGWPDQFSNLYAEEEMQAHTSKDITPSQEIEQEAAHRRENALGGRGILMNMDSSGALSRVPMGEVADRCLEFIKDSDAETVWKWSIQNREPLREFWAAAPNDALEVKKQIEAKTATLEIATQ